MRASKTARALGLALLAGGLAGCAAYLEDEPGQEKVVLCHKGKKTLQVAAPAADAHYRHGDRPGPCR